MQNWLLSLPMREGNSAHLIGSVGRLRAYNRGKVFSSGERNKFNCVFVEIDLAGKSNKACGLNSNFNINQSVIFNIGFFDC